jgi:hypothetical protein
VHYRALRWLAIRPAMALVPPWLGKAHPVDWREWSRPARWCTICPSQQ